ncbi:hypothetical protein CBS63078_1590 [Aspergillus niger]|nr:hypothetical protein CBS115989_3466 [Aspergillus niger]RDH23283.1 hypothetical protein M747DRAFT_166145 [Aspergillus niger ATCC 13496]KAI2860856.1 hypothetical protein CBS11232_1099 [Aspergillus niger]KAI2864392.1 hypothetical protein CBS12448_2885 [Aspergillus niger]KAI2880164.1 hypothetical protein CBS115988_1613 [Aspergillus niger]|eukprot:XP_001400443.2 hypothetical protein ANI_1_3206024 [Aspergillus niger CBS 513.88]
MVFSLVMMSTLVPTIIGLNEATKGARDQEESRRAESRSRRCHLIATCEETTGSPTQRQQVHNAKVYLDKDYKIYIVKQPSPSMAPFTGQFYTHPAFGQDNSAGLISMSPEEPPLARWVYLDKDTKQLSYGNRKDSEENVCGPFDWTEDEEYVTLEGNERWLAVRLPDDARKEQEAKDLGLDDDKAVKGLWRLYFDRDDNSLDLPEGTETVKIRLKRDPVEEEDDDSF